MELNGKGCAKYRCVQFYVPQNAKVYITAQHNNDYNATRYLEISNEFGYVLNDGDNSLSFNNVPSTKMFSYNGTGENICIYSRNNSISLRKIQVVCPANENYSPYWSRFWNFGDSDFDNYVSGTDVGGLTIIGGLGTSAPTPGPNNYYRYLWTTSGNYNDDCVYFNVCPNSIISIVARSHSSEPRQIVVIDQYGCLVGELDVDDQIREFNIPYAGNASRIYAWSVDSNARIYAAGFTRHSTLNSSAPLESGYVIGSEVAEAVHNELYHDELCDIEGEIDVEETNALEIQEQMFTDDILSGSSIVIN